MSSTHKSLCFLCEASCGLEVTIDEGRIARIEGDRDDPISRGYICPKGAAIADIQHDPDRVLHPLRRVGDRWEAIGWTEALDWAAERLHAIQSRDGRDAVALYLGNPTAHSYTAALTVVPFLQALGTRNFFTANSVDGMPRSFTSYQMYGHQMATPVPDIDRTHYLLCLGGNPLVSQGSLMGTPDARRHLRAIRERGGKIVVVDPRRTETAEGADAHYFIRPGTDAFFLMALVHTIFAEGLDRPGRLAPLTDGLGEVRRLVADWTPERAAAVTGIDAPAIRAVAREFAAAPSAVCYGRMGTCVQEFGAVASWLTDVANVVTGNLDRPGGAMFTTPAVDVRRIATLLGQTGSYGQWRSRVGGYAEVGGEIPVAALAEEIETPGPGQIRALVVHAGNPVLSNPNGARLDRALAGLEFMVAVDLYVNETTRHADLILPSAFGFEHDQYALLTANAAVRNGARYGPKLMEAPAGVREDHWILTELTARLLARRGVLGRLSGGAARTFGRRVGPRGMLRAALRFGPHGKGVRGEGLTLGALERRPEGVDLGPLVPRLPGLLATKGRRIRLAPAPMVADLARLVARERELLAAEPNGGLVLIGRRHLRSNNSWMHNAERLARGKDRCTLLMHPKDAEGRGIASGDRVRVTSRVGSVVATVAVSEEMMPGVVSLPHGWGHGRPGARQGVAARHAGVSLNDLTDERRVDRVTGATNFAVPVEIARAEAS